jgi:hypothetical protein
MLAASKLFSDQCLVQFGKGHEVASELLVVHALVTGNSGMVTFWEVQHGAMPAKRHACHAVPSGGHSALTVTVPPMQRAVPTTPCILVGAVP